MLVEKREEGMMMVTTSRRSSDQHANTFKYAQMIPGNRFII